MFKKDTFKKVWGFLSGMASFVVMYKQVAALSSLSEDAKDYLKDQDLESFVNPISNPASQIEKLKSGV